MRDNAGSGVLLVSALALFAAAIIMAGTKATEQATESKVSACLAIQVPNHRALFRQEPALRYAIQQADLRAECRADVALKRQ